MFEQAAVSPLLLSSNEEESYQTCLDACIEGIENFPVIQRRKSKAGHFTVRSFAKHVVTLPTPLEPPYSLPSPSSSPQHEILSSHPASPSLFATMDRSLPYGGPPRNNSGSSHDPQATRASQDVKSSQDARSNLAVQPAANKGVFKLKKNAVKIVGAARSAPSTAPVTNSLRASTSLPTSLSSPAPCQTSAQPKTFDVHEPPEVLKPNMKASSLNLVPILPPSKAELSPQRLVEKSSLDDMFARLSAATSVTLPRPAEEPSPVGPAKSVFSFDGRIDPSNITTKPSGDVESFECIVPSQPDVLSAVSEGVQLKSQSPQPTMEAQGASSSTTGRDMSQDELEQEYLCKAAAYVNALPFTAGSNAFMIKTVSTKLRASYPPKLDDPEAKRLRAQYNAAVTDYVNKRINISSEPLVADFVEKALHDSNGDFLALCAALVEGNYITLESLQHVIGLCQSILDVLPKAGGTPAARFKPTKADMSKKTPAAIITAPMNVPKVPSADPSNGMEIWPTQQKREHGAVYRSCVLKGVSGVKSLNELQALVWGGRLESISMPMAGSGYALVKFLTPEACQAYLEATKNGIEIQNGTKKAIIFVDRQTESNSINDVIENCIKRDASRCIRVTGADDDWSNGALLKLARGKQQTKRNVDRIKQGKTACGHHYIEFRFGDIYHALSFKRCLMDDEEWEHCSIGYAPDPCELAHGVHYKDPDDE